MPETPSKFPAIDESVRFQSCDRSKHIFLEQDVTSNTEAPVAVLAAVPYCDTM